MVGMGMDLYLGKRNTIITLHFTTGHGVSRCKAALLYITVQLCQFYNGSQTSCAGQRFCRLPLSGEDPQSCEGKGLCFQGPRVRGVGVGEGEEYGGAEVLCVCECVSECEMGGGEEWGRVRG